LEVKLVKIVVSISGIDIIVDRAQEVQGIVVAIDDCTGVLLAFDVAERFDKVNELSLEFGDIDGTNQIGVDDCFFVDSTKFIEDLPHKVLESSPTGNGKYVGHALVEAAHWVFLWGFN
jgi:hypothetical protein